MSNEVSDRMDGNRRSRLPSIRGKRTGFLDVHRLNAAASARKPASSLSSKPVQKEAETSFLTFSLNRTEQKAYDHFAKHRCTDPKGPLLSVRFMPTGIAYSIQVECRCGRLKDISDAHSW